MNAMDDVTINAYADGELDASSLREFEARLFTDPDLMKRVREIRHHDELLREAFPLEPAIRASKAGDLPARRPRTRTPRLALAMVASVAVLAFGVAIGLAVNGINAADPEGAEALARSSSLQRALEHELSGVPSTWGDPDAGRRGQVMPVSTYRNAEGRFCREFEEERVVEGVIIREGGVGCRDDDGRWRVRIRYYP